MGVGIAEKPFQVKGYQSRNDQSPDQLTSNGGCIDFDAWRRDSLVVLCPMRVYDAYRASQNYTRLSVDRNHLLCRVLL